MAVKAISKAQRSAAVIVALLEGKPSGCAKTETMRGELGLTLGEMGLALAVAVRKGYVASNPLRGTITLTGPGRLMLDEGRAIIDADAAT